MLRKEGPKYQYGTGCLSDGVLGAWIAEMCGLGQILDEDKVRSHLMAVYKHNFRHDLSGTPIRNVRRLRARTTRADCCSAPGPRAASCRCRSSTATRSGPGIEYQVASHLMLMGRVDEGLDIVRACRDRYDGRVRNPFSEIECGHFYARALASYGLLQALSGARYDAVDKILYLTPSRGRLPRVPVHRHRLRHRRRARRQTVPRCQERGDRRGRADRNRMNNVK